MLHLVPVRLAANFLGAHANAHETRFLFILGLVGGQSLDPIRRIEVAVLTYVDSEKNVSTDHSLVPAQTRTRTRTTAKSK